jgi:hypothetical protein
VKDPAKRITVRISTQYGSIYVQVKERGMSDVSAIKEKAILGTKGKENANIEARYDAKDVQRMRDRTGVNRERMRCVAS